jgi:arylsulfatase A-like enzyme
MAKFQASIGHLDRQFHLFWQGLKKLGYDKNSIVIFTTDHGIANERSKSTLYDRGLEIALTMHLPQHFRAPGCIHETIPNIDVMPTLLEAAGVALPDDIQGKSFYPFLLEKPYLPRKEIFAEFNFGMDDFTPMRCVRTERYKLIRNYSRETKWGWLPQEIPYMNESYQGSFYNLYPPRKSAPEFELYDLRADPLEQNNVADNPDYAAVRKELEDMLHGWMQQTHDFVLAGVKPQKTEPERFGFADTPPPGYTRHLHPPQSVEL